MNFKRFGITTSRPHVNKTDRGIHQYFYDKERKQKVLSLFKGDFLDLNISLRNLRISFIVRPRWHPLAVHQPGQKLVDRASLLRIYSCDRSPPQVN